MITQTRLTTTTTTTTTTNDRNKGNNGKRTQLYMHADEVDTLFKPEYRPLGRKMAKWGRGEG